MSRRLSPCREQRWHRPHAIDPAQNKARGNIATSANCSTMLGHHDPKADADRLFPRPDLPLLGSSKAAYGYTRSSEAAA